MIYSVGLPDNRLQNQLSPVGLHDLAIFDISKLRAGPCEAAATENINYLARRSADMHSWRHLWPAHVRQLQDGGRCCHKQITAITCGARHRVHVRLVDTE